MDTHKKILIAVLTLLSLSLWLAVTADAQEEELMPYMLIDDSLLGQDEPEGIPSIAEMSFAGFDPDGSTGQPVKYRYLLKEAWTESEGYINSRASFEYYLEELVSFADPLWSEWLPYPTEAEDQVIHTDLPFDYSQRWLLAFQVMDEEGAVSVDRRYGYSIAHFKIVENLAPALHVFEPTLGIYTAYFSNGIEMFEIAADQPLNFQWIGNVSYPSHITAYRYGWDILDPDDPADPGWAVEPGMSPEHLYAPETSFSSGLHSLIIRVWDAVGNITQIKFLLDVVPIPPLHIQFPLLLVDDVDDHNSQRWPNSSGVPLDTDVMRDMFWLDTLDHVNGFFPHLHVRDSETDQISYRDLVNHRSVIWTSKYVQAPRNAISRNFRPQSGCSGAQYIWLAQYQRNAGNLMLVGSRNQDSFIEEDDTWMVPMVFDTDEEYLFMNNQQYRVGFGQCELPDGSMQANGLEQYPYKTIGLSLIDAVSPTYHIYARMPMGFMDRRAQCVGAKGLILNEEFKTSYIPGDAISDTILTNTDIDWYDDDSEYYDNLLFPWAFKDTEFYDANIADRPTPWAPQLCEDEPCIKPMFEIFSRYDWIRQQHVEQGDPDWPLNVYTPAELENSCGELALTADYQSARTHRKVCGFISNKTIANKPSQKGDVIWGFDPYRYDSQQIKEAIHWVLGEHFGLTLD